MLSVTLALLGVLRDRMPVICSMAALVSSTPAACSLAACDSDWAVLLTSSAALVESVALFTSPMIIDSFSTVLLAYSFISP